MKYVKAVFLFLLLTSLTACIGPFTETDFGKFITLPVGTPFEVRLHGDPDSDFVWKVSDLDTNVVMMVFKPEYKPLSDNGQDGGVYSFYFQTVGEGKTQLEMVYTASGNEEELGKISRVFSMEVESKI